MNSLADKALRKAVSGNIEKRTASLSIPQKHQLKIARDSMKKNCVFARLTGFGHREAAKIIEQLTGAIVGIDAPCDC